MKQNTLKKRILSKIILIGSVTFILVSILSYFLLVKPMNDRTLMETQVTNVRVIQQTDYLLSHIRDYTNMIAINDNFREKYVEYMNESTASNHSQISIALSELVSQWKNVNAIVIEIEDGETFESIGKLTEIDKEIISGDWYSNIRHTDYANGFSKMYEREPLSGIYTAAYSKNYYLFGKRYTATLFFNASEIVYAMQNLSRGKMDAYMWMGEDDKPFYFVGNETWRDYISQEVGKISRWGNNRLDGCGGVSIINHSEISDWQFVSYISDVSLYKAGASYTISLLLVLVQFYLLVIVFIPSTVNKAIHPINVLADTMQEVSKGNLDVRAEIHTNDEIEDVSNVFNGMIDELKDHIFKLINKEKVEQKIRYSLMASQINHHFIFNTMNRINYLAKTGESEKIIIINTALIKIMKDSLRFSSEDIMDTVEKEIEVVRQYLTIIGSHYNDIIDVEWDIDSKLLECRIPKNIIQPLVENAVFHGLINEQGEIRGKVMISIQSDDRDYVVICVSDNGNGMRTEQLESLHSKYSTREMDRGLHVGLKNIRGRLTYLYGDEDCLRIESEIDRGTKVTLTLKSV